MSLFLVVQISVIVLAVTVCIYFLQKLRILPSCYESRRNMQWLRLCLMATITSLGGLLLVTLITQRWSDPFGISLIALIILLSGFSYWLMARVLLCLKRQFEQRQRHDQQHDKTTGLPNRAFAYRYLEDQLALHQENDSVLMILLLSGINFVDDRYGLGTAEMVISEVSRRVHVNLRRTDFVARVSEHALLVFISNVRTCSDATVIAEHITEAVRKPIQLAQHAPSISPHIGMINLRDAYNEEVAMLVRQAQLVAVEAQARGMSVLSSSEEMLSRSGQVHVLEDWHQALITNGLELYYQPQIDLSSKEVIGAEALLRFPTLQGFSLDNKDFSVLLSQSGLTHELNRFVFEKLLAQLREWRSTGLTIPIGFNVSIRSFQNHQFISMLVNTLKGDQPIAEQLKIEVIESESIESMNEVVQSMKTLKQYGVKFSIDDFGTRYASMEYLQQLPIQEVKIDKSFVLNALNDEASADIVKASLELANKLGFKVIAEGIETEEIKDWLMSMGCRYGQGYYFAAPMPATEFKDWVLAE